MGNGSWYPEPPRRLGSILRYTNAVAVTQAEFILRLRMSLLSGLAIPLHSLGIVQRHSLGLAAGLYIAEVVLRGGIARRHQFM
jgi:hypothetical protein